MILSREQEKQVRQAFMTAMAKRLCREGVIDTRKLSRLIIRIERSGGECAAVSRDGRPSVTDSIHTIG